MMSYDNEQAEMAKTLAEKAKIKIFLSKGATILATAQVTFGDLIEVNGFTIKSSQYDGLWIQPPTYGKNYRNAFFVKDKKLYKHLLEEIERAYKNELEVQGVTDAVEEIGF